MNKKIIIGIAVVTLAVAVLGVAGFAFAQTQTPPVPDNAYGPGMMRQGRPGAFGSGMMGGSGSGMMQGWNDEGYGPMHEYMVKAFAEALGLTPEELQSKLDSGETPWTIAQAQGLSQEDFTKLMVDARAKALQQAVTDGVLTQKQADWMNQRMQQMQGNGFGPGGCPMNGSGFGPGRGRGMRGSNP